MHPRSELGGILRAGSLLIDPVRVDPPADLCALLTSRLAQYHTAINDKYVTPASTLEELQLETAQEALFVVEKVQKILISDESPRGSPPESRDQETVGADGAFSAIGTRDLAQLRTLLSVAFKWGVEPLFVLVTSAWPNKPSLMVPPRPKIIDLTTSPKDHKRLSSLLERLLGLLFPDGVHGSFPHNFITTTLLNRHLTDLLKPCIGLGWLPKSLSSEVAPTIHEIRPKIMRLLEILPPSQTISALGAVLSGTPAPAIHARKSCASLLSRQLLRPEGVLGLCAAVFGDGGDPEDNIQLEKLEQIAKVLSTGPTGLKPKEYFDLIVPRILALLSNPSPLSYRRAAAFTLSRMLAMDSSRGHQLLAASSIIPILHDPFLQVIDLGRQGLSPDSHSPVPTELPYTLSPTSALSTLMALILHTDPSPTLISTLLSPIMPCLYTLSAHLNCMKTADPLLRESVNGLLTTWGRVVVSEECLSNLWYVLEGAGGDWLITIAGDVRKVERADAPGLSLLTPEDLRRSESTRELDFDSNLLDLRPDPAHFVRFLKSINRTDVSSDLFVKLLEAYRDTRTAGEVDPMRTMLYLQVIMQMQTQLAESAGPSNILSKPKHILSFIKHALVSTTIVRPPVSHGVQHKTKDTLGTQDFRIVLETNDSSDNGDSDDETPVTSDVSTDVDMTDTAVNLLLAILEANEELSARNTPDLNDIFTLLEPLASERSDIQSLAREARMVMTARLASASGMQYSKPTLKYADKEKTHETYQKALKLLQDPILPVRAHGLLLLRQLVSPRSSGLNDGSQVDPALIPSILSIFLQAVQDDDSYMFLNAVQGLAAMVETFGRDVLNSLLVLYSEHLDGLSGSNMTQSDVDKRLRIGEALGQVIRRCGDTLGAYVEIIVPSLVCVFRSHHVPTALRTSALSLLSECVKTSSLAFLPYTLELSEAMVDLLQIESMPEASKTNTRGFKPKEPKATMDSESTVIDSKHPALRRAALHFLALLIRSSTADVYNSGYIYNGPTFSGPQARRAKTTLAYVASTDVDNFVRVMAREVLEGMDQLNEAFIGNVA